MGRGQIIVYQYAEGKVSEEFEIDLTGELHFTKGEILVRCGCNWKINSIMIEEPTSNTRLTIWLELVHAPVN